MGTEPLTPGCSVSQRTLPPKAPRVWATIALGAALPALAALAFVRPQAAGAAEAKPFGIAQFQMQTTRASTANPLGYEPYVYSQAGGHPFALTTKVEFTSETIKEGRAPTQDPRDVAIDLPPGLLANPQAVAACRHGGQEKCPLDAQVGVFVVRSSSATLLAPIFNIAPSGQEAAELGMETPLGLIALSGRLVRTPAGYGLAVKVSGLPQLGVVGIEMTLWGVPADKAHDAQRGRTCTGTASNIESNCSGGGVASGEEARPFLTMPSDCGQATAATAWTDSWIEPGHWAKAQSSLAALDGCDRLSFWPELKLRPDSLQPEAPVAAGLTLSVPQSESPLAVAAPALRSAEVALPPGMTIDPAIANGAQACPATGPEGIGLPTGVGPDGEALSPDEVGVGEERGPDGQARLAPGHCPQDSTVGTAEAQSPLLAGALSGRVYLAAPLCGGPGQGACTEADAADGNLYRLYIELGGRGEARPRGAIVKIVGLVLADPATGQLAVRLLEAPQLPLSTLTIELFGGRRALLTNPPGCGPATTTSDLQPWGSPFVPDAAPSSYYEVTGCMDPRPFAPALIAGSRSIVAGAFTPFTIDVARAAGEQQVAQLQLHAPLGLAAMLASVTLCAQAQASAGECPAASLVGSSTVAVGSGYEPLSLPGKVYLTGPYEGAPFGLAIVTSAVAGPLDLGSVTIRARIDVDPHTAALTISSDPLPRMLLGVPLRMRRLALDIDRPGFLLNPTDCRAQQVQASIAGAQGSVANDTNSFGIAECAALRFAPRLSASTRAPGRLRDGTSLDVKLAQPRAALGTQANLAKVRMALPARLSSRLTALQGSCPGRVFEADAARCPASSIVGVARARSPLLPGLLAGPVYFVAHGPRAFPAPTVVLQGDGVRLDLSGAVAVERSGATSIAFPSLPDIPLASVELYLPRGPHSALTVAPDVCAAARRRHGSLRLPVELAGHNGRVLHRRARISVLGCNARR